MRKRKRWKRMKRDADKIVVYRSCSICKRDSRIVVNNQETADKIPLEGYICLICGVHRKRPTKPLVGEVVHEEHK